MTLVVTDEQQELGILGVRFISFRPPPTVIVMAIVININMVEYEYEYLQIFNSLVHIADPTVLPFHSQVH